MKTSSTLQISWDSFSGNLLFAVSEAIGDRDALPTWKKVAVYAASILFVYPALLVTTALDLAFWSVKSVVLLTMLPFAVIAALLALCAGELHMPRGIELYLENHLKDLVATIALPILGLANLLTNQLPDSNRPGGEYTLNADGFVGASRDNKSQLLRHFFKKGFIGYGEVHSALNFAKKASSLNTLIDLCAELDLTPTQKQQIINQVLWRCPPGHPKRSKILARMIHSCAIDLNDPRLLKYAFNYNLKDPYIYFSLFEFAFLQCDENLLTVILDNPSFSLDTLDVSAFKEFHSFIERLVERDRSNKKAHEADPTKPYQPITIETLSTSLAIQKDLTDEERTNRYYQIFVSYFNIPPSLSNSNVSVLKASLDRVAQTLEKHRKKVFSQLSESITLSPSHEAARLPPALANIAAGYLL